MKDVRGLQIIPTELVKPFKSNFLPRLAKSRAELLEKLLAELGTENSGFTPDNVMTVTELNPGHLYTYKTCMEAFLFRDLFLSYNLVFQK